jgi:hypothetical protein
MQQAAPGGGAAAGGGYGAFEFAPRRGAPDWRAVQSIDAERFFRGVASADELSHLSACGAHLRACALEADPRAADAANGARFRAAALVLSLAGELDAAAAADDLRDAYDKLDALRAENEALRVRDVTWRGV